MLRRNIWMPSNRTRPKASGAVRNGATTHDVALAAQRKLTARAQERFIDA